MKRAAETGGWMGAGWAGSWMGGAGGWANPGYPAESHCCLPLLLAISQLARIFSITCRCYCAAVVYAHIGFSHNIITLTYSSTSQQLGIRFSLTINWLITSSLSITRCGYKS